MSTPATSYTLIDGKKASEAIKEKIAADVVAFKAQGGKTPHLAAIIVGNDGASETYVGNKVRTCEAIGFKSTLVRFPAEISEAELLQKVEDINNDPDIDGLIAFYESPLGRKVTATLPQITRESMTAGQQWGRAKAEEVMRELHGEGILCGRAGVTEARSRKAVPARVL